MAHRHSRRRRAIRATKLEWAIFIGGLVLSVIAGVIAYRIVGIYGDGPFSIGYHRMRDPQTGKSLLVHESRDASGKVIRRVIDDRTLKEVELDVDANGVAHTKAEVTGTTITRLERDRDGDGRTDAWEYYGPDGKITKIGFSLGGDGVLDAWAYRDDQGQIVKIEVSTRHDGVVDRWEYYSKGQLARAEEDSNHDGKVDRWLTYDSGILMDTAIDANGDGKPDR